MKEVRLNNGVMMPAIGFGLFQVPVNETERVVTDALETGYRMFDCAASYFNEKQLGEAIRRSGIRREELFITTKLWVQDYEYEDALKAFDKSMKLLGLDYLDLYLLHKPYGNYYAAWRAAEKLYREGLVKAIGVTSFSSERLQDLYLHNEIRPAVNQLQCNVLCQQEGIQKYLSATGTRMMAWGPLGGQGSDSVIKNPLLGQIGSRYGKTASQVALRWLVQRGIAAIPKSTRRERMEQNIGIFDFTLSDAEMKQIASLNMHDEGTVNFNDPGFIRYLAEAY